MLYRKQQNYRQKKQLAITIKISQLNKVNKTKNNTYKKKNS